MRLGLTNNIKSRGGTPAVWAPDSASNLQLWFRKGVGITESDGTEAEDTDAVHGWADQSGNNRHATGAATRFTYNAADGSVLGTGNNKLDLTSVNFGDEFSFYVRINFDTISGGATDIMFNDATGASNDDFFRVQTTTKLRAKIGGGSAMDYTTSTIPTGSYINIGFERDSSDDCRAYIGAVQQDSEINRTPEFNLDRIIGALDGYCQEIVIYNKSLSDADRLLLNTYLNTL